jgi:aspartyl-tRNA(Asn)/glutamyl-tRNA(Gln) amidotransferase subunit A
MSLVAEEKVDTADKIDVRLAAAHPAPGDELSWLPAWRLRELLATRYVSPVEVTEHFLARCEALDPDLHAFRVLDIKGARKAAQAAEKAVMAGEELGALHGVPLAIKELIAVRGMPFPDAYLGKRVIAPRDAIEVERLRAAGAVIFGTAVGGLTAREFGVSELQPQNPWDRGRVCGDSSTGVASALASGMVAGGIGTDGQGSNRLPAAYCGLVGMLATRGRVATADWSQLTSRPISATGPIVRDVRDAATMLSVLAGPDGRDIMCLQDEAPDYLAGLDSGCEGMRLAWTDDFGFAPKYAGPEAGRVIALVKSAALGLRSAGAAIEETAIDLEDPHWLGNMLTLGDPGLSIHKPLTPDEVAGARETRARIWTKLRTVLSDHEFIISPTSQHVAPTREAWSKGWEGVGDYHKPSFMANYTAHTSVANFLGWPAISVPAGLVDGLPVGFQILGLPHSEPRMLRLAQAFLAMRG